MKKIIIGLLALGSISSFATHADSSLRCITEIRKGVMFQESKAFMVLPDQEEIIVEFDNYYAKLKLQNLNSDLDSMLNYNFGAGLFKKEASGKTTQIHRINLSVPSLQSHFVVNAGTLNDVGFIVSCFKH